MRLYFPVVWYSSPSSAFPSIFSLVIYFSKQLQVALVYDGEKTVVVAFYVKCVRRYESMEGEYEENDPHAEERAQDVHLRMVIFF